MSRVVFIFCALFIYVHVTECGVFGRSSSGKTGAKNYMGSYDGGEPYPQAQRQKGGAPRTARSNGGLSAWGLIMIIMTVILLGFGAYYVIICYPFFCKNERTYQFMDASSTITGATSRSIQSIENFQHDQKARL